MDRLEPPISLIGRSADKAWLTGLLRAAVEGHGAAGVLRGDAGVGKTFLISSVLAEHPQLPMKLIAGVEAEADLPYAALQRMILAHRAALDDLTEAQRAALLVACGLASGPPASKSLVGLGLLNLLARVSDEAPFVCFIDDGQWVDRESLDAFAFVARRILAERLVLLFAVRSNDAEPTPLDDLPARTLAGLSHADALTLLETSSPQTLDPRVADQIVDATGGNPLALVDLLTDLTERQLRGEDLLPEPVPLGKHLEAHYLRQGRQLPQETQMWLLAAATEPEGDLEAITAASDALGLRDNASRAAELAGLVRVNSTVTFRHPLVRSAIYNGSPSHDIRAMHLQLAHAAERRGDTYRWVTHRAAATIGPDDEVADKLEEAADMAMKRGGYMTRTNLLVRSAALTSAQTVKNLRLLAAAESAIAAGAPAQAGALLGALEPEGLDDLARGRLFMASCDLDTLAPVPGPIYAHRPQRLLVAARLFRSTAPARAKQAIASAYWALVQADEMVQGTSSREVAEEARRICEMAPGSDLPTQALIALSTLVLDGPAAAASLVRATIEQASAPGIPDEDILQSFISVAYAACLLRDPESSEAVLQRAEHAARNLGATLVLCRILLLGAYLNMRQGRIREGSERLNSAAEIISFMGLPKVWADMVTSLPVLRGWLDDESITREDEVSAEARTFGYGLSGASRLVGTLLLRAAESRYVEAWIAGRQIRHDDPFFTGALYLPDLIECAARAGDHKSANLLLLRLREESHHSRSRWAEGLEERSMTHLDEDTPAPHFERALELLTGPALEMDAARTHLLYGEWLRRRRRRTEAAAHLFNAFEIFQRLGALGWSARARRELAALGETLGHNKQTLAATLTPQELSVARLAAAGNTNADIGAELFLSSHTVDYHLRKVFRKLGVTSRRQLHKINLG
ncbi:LuxR family transcriptional regulator [Arthrobacter sp. MSA 4-2]|uniref:helix-turn-helix transcriptional regulator n=1 Tax=Arthrobacter sp. MSA 4-2 TaxID=2794349 RepID=UPI0018E8D035|nr:LuxR family transcriptional regulator [Arthrobacter sp. MSA 4-2]